MFLTISKGLLHKPLATKTADSALQFYLGYRREEATCLNSWSVANCINSWRMVFEPLSV